MLSTWPNNRMKNTFTFNNKIQAKLYCQKTLLSTEQKGFYSDEYKKTIQIRHDGYQPFLFLLRFFFGFGRHIDFSGVEGNLAAVFLSLRACLQEENQKLNELVFIKWATCCNYQFQSNSITDPSKHHVFNCNYGIIKTKLTNQITAHGRWISFIWINQLRSCQNQTLLASSCFLRIRSATFFFCFNLWLVVALFAFAVRDMPIIWVKLQCGTFSRRIIMKGAPF